MPNSNYFNPVKIVSGINKIETIKEYLPEGRVLIITSRSFKRKGIAQKLSAQTGREDTVIFDEVSPNPEVDNIDSTVLSFKDRGFECVVALGGGSVIDFAKAVAVFLKDGANRSLDACLRRQSAESPDEKLFLIAIPTTAGTGSEVTPFATVWDSVHQKKYSLAGEMVFPSLAILDPALTVELPPEITLSTGLDVISHSLESIWNKNRSPISEAYALQSLRIIYNSFPAVLEKPDNIKARAEMQWASTLAGFAISQTRTAIAHSISYPLTLKFGIPHGFACSFILTGLIDIFLKEEKPGADIKDLLEKIKYLLKSLNLNEIIGKYATPALIKGLVDEMYNPSRADNYIYKADEEFILQLLL